MAPSSKSLLAAAAFYDSEHGRDLTSGGVDPAVGRRIVQHFFDACLNVGGGEPRLLDGDGLTQALADGLPRYFGPKDEAAAAIEATVGAFLEFTGETEVVTHAFEQRQALPEAVERCMAAIESGTMAGIGVTAAGTVRSRGDKVGRNDPCPCGSGKKFKKCCFGLGSKGGA